MNKNRPKGLATLRTRSGQVSDADNPHRKFLRVANLELRKSLCIRVREAAARRVAEMDEQLAEIEAMQAQLLRTADTVAQRTPTPVRRPHFLAYDETAKQDCFTLKY
jgi:hypothetical protein